MSETIEATIRGTPPKTGAGKRALADLFDCALDAVRRGFKVLPVLARQKLPAGRLVPHGCADATTSEALVRQWWSEYPQLNIGITGGVIVDVDSGIDSLEAALTWAKSMGLPETLAIRTGRRSSYGIQFHFTGQTQSGPYSIGGVSGEIRCQNQYGLFAGSVHPSGSRYELAADAPRAPWPVGCPVERSRAFVTNHLRKTTVASLQSGEKIPASQRHFWLVSQAGQLLRRGIKGDQLLQSLQGLRDLHCEHPEQKSDSELEQIRESCERLYGSKSHTPPTPPVFGGQSKPAFSFAEAVLPQRRRRRLCPPSQPNNVRYGIIFNSCITFSARC
jgi:hypothetical protein